MSKELNYMLGDKVRLVKDDPTTIRKIVKIDERDDQLPYLVMKADSEYENYSINWVPANALERVPFKIADLFEVYRTPSYRGRKFITPHGHTIYFEDKEIRVSHDDWFIYEEITNVFTSYDMMDIDIIEIDIIEIKEKHKEMTVEEIEEELGYKIKIVGD